MSATVFPTPTLLLLWIHCLLFGYDLLSAMTYKSAVFAAAVCNFARDGVDQPTYAAGGRQISWCRVSEYSSSGRRWTL